MKTGVFNLLVFVSIIQGLILFGVFYFRKSGNRLSNKLFAALILIYIINLFDSYARSTIAYRYFIEYHKPIFISSLLIYLSGPVFYLFLKSLNDNSFRLTRMSLLHLLPFSVILIFALFHIASTEHFIIWHSGLYRFNMYAILMHMIIYIILSFSLLYKWRESNYQADKSTNHKLNVFVILVVAFIVIWITKLQSFAILMVFKKIGWCAYTESVYYTAIFLLINLLIILGLINPGLLSFIDKKSNAVFDINLITEYSAQIKELLERGKIYRNSELSLAVLSNNLNLHPRYVSEVINKAFNKSFISLINEYRIKESVDLMKSDKNKKTSVKEICYSVGFNSRSAFNNSFKKITGLSPSEYIKNLAK